MDQPIHQNQIDINQSDELNNWYQIVQANYNNYRANQNIQYDLSQSFDMLLKGIELSINHQYEESNKYIDQILQIQPSDECSLYFREYNNKKLNRYTLQIFQPQTNDQTLLNTAYLEAQAVQNKNFLLIIDLGNQYQYQNLENQQSSQSTFQQNSENLRILRQLNMSSEWYKQLQIICDDNFKEDKNKQINLGSKLLHQGHYEQAIKCFDKAIKLNLNKYEYQLFKWVALAKMDKLNQNRMSLEI